MTRVAFSGLHSVYLTTLDETKRTRFVQAVKTGLGLAKQTNSEFNRSYFTGFHITDPTFAVVRVAVPSTSKDKEVQKLETKIETFFKKLCTQYTLPKDAYSRIVGPFYGNRYGTNLDNDTTRAIPITDNTLMFDPIAEKSPLTSIEMFNTQTGELVYRSHECTLNKDNSVKKPSVTTLEPWQRKLINDIWRDYRKK